ncbi:class IIb bacteriocin, lactobin A/cerein 7B family [Neisseria sp.]|uniref:class IIb bacteriocin, lactobin A/cerein 7B family n=1 Tax=Neisseria sp. TaxID=192066 RepID=UPI0026DB4AE2|nr:class IIb bacteriocin, lactobin A/cerein 7B family [Neisseria sp.]MDO4906694.1 class IIb bacteriocin, lactobin A/cerein 7B family [Neisseria sp.]
MKELNQFELEQISGGIAPAIIVGYLALGGVGFTGGIATGVNRKNRGDKSAL